MTALRFIGSALLAFVVVMAMLLGGLKLFGAFDNERPRHDYQPVEMLSELERSRLAELLGETGRRLPEAPQQRDIPRFELPQRQISGFVQLEVDVGSDGRVDAVRVLDAVPAGHYEEQARELLRSRRYAPSDAGRQHVEIIEFEIPAESP